MASHFETEANVQRYLRGEPLENKEYLRLVQVMSESLSVDLQKVVH